MYWLGRPKSYHHPSVENGALKPLHSWCCRFGFKLCNQMVDADAADDFFPLARFFITWKLWATITPAAYVHILVLFNEFYVLWLSFASVRVDGACVCAVCVCVLATLTMKLEFRSEVLVFVMLINLCQCVVCVSLPESFDSMLLNFFRPCSLFLSPSHGVVFKNSFFSTWITFYSNLNYIRSSNVVHQQSSSASHRIFNVSIPYTSFWLI